MKTVTASFTINTWEEHELDASRGNKFIRTSLTKTFSGEINGTSAAEMQMAHGHGGSMAYLGFERLDVTIGSQQGTFVLRHNAIQSAGEQAMELTVVDGFGTGDFEALTGSATITRAEDDTHTFTLTYESG